MGLFILRLFGLLRILLEVFPNHVNDVIDPKWIIAHSEKLDPEFLNAMPIPPRSTPDDENRNGASLILTWRPALQVGISRSFARGRSLPECQFLP
jgi:hypothetical protein